MPTPPAAPTRVRWPRTADAPAIPANRVTISADLLRYARDVHRADEHNGVAGYRCRTCGCRTCARYALGIRTAAAREHTDSDAFELPTSAANAYATAVRPHVGGLPVTMSACRGTTTDPAPANTAETTAPNATATSPHSNAQAPASAPNASASNGPE